MVSNCIKYFRYFTPTPSYYTISLLVLSAPFSFLYFLSFFLINNLPLPYSIYHNHNHYHSISSIIYIIPSPSPFSPLFHHLSKITPLHHFLPYLLPLPSQSPSTSHTFITFLHYLSLSLHQPPKPTDHMPTQPSIGYPPSLPPP